MEGMSGLVSKLAARAVCLCAELPPVLGLDAIFDACTPTEQVGRRARMWKAASP
jgi:hypothetical protein